jgi:hypothetical protein
MGDLAEWLFKVGYLPIRHQSVKHEFLRWYRTAALDSYVIEGLDADNADLTSLALDAASHAEHFDDEVRILEIFEIFEKKLEQLETWFHYIVLGSVLFGGSMTATGVYAVRAYLIELVLSALGVLTGGSALVAISLYYALKHYLNNSAELIKLFNEELTEKPGHIRRHDREWPDLAAAYFWNESLSRPPTILVLILLSVIQFIRPSLFGRISADLQFNIQEFIKMDAKDIVKHQLDRVRDVDAPPYTEYPSSPEQ